ncbi:hypothetical protein EVAR_20923_1 [Eumeta japonica]|uniref:ATP-dependent DNA helicase PIF1 n=1 Tax=Eumeta variegata TaxID=151549 RepID=A0A4C1UW60_EUMVA|nr:hypothetical protein EVAR_20923_1 [Eumeta japonica]
MRNRLCNGTRLRVTERGRHIEKATILTGEVKGDNVLIPHIPIMPSNLQFNIKRLQFSLKVAFSMTINKSQGQTLKCDPVQARSRELVPAAGGAGRRAPAGRASAVSRISQALF